jgi:hypothetical protein
MKAISDLNDARAGRVIMWPGAWGCCLLASDYWQLTAGCCLAAWLLLVLATCCWLLDVGCKLLAAGCKLLAAGCILDDGTTTHCAP